MAGRAGVPVDAAAVMLNVTAVVPAAPGFLTVFPCGAARPLASNVNYVAGEVVPNAVFAKVGAGGKVCVYTLSATDLIADVNGWFESQQTLWAHRGFTAGGAHTCGVRTDTEPELQRAGVTTLSGRPPLQRARSSPWPPGGAHTCGVRTDATVTCWGSNVWGQANPPTGTFVTVTAGVFHTCGLRTDGTATCWGYNASGQVTPPPGTFDGTFSSLAAGGYHTCGLRSDATATC